MGFLKKSPQHECRENEILAYMTELSDEEVNQLDFSGGQSRKQKAQHTFHNIGGIGTGKNVAGKDEDQRRPSGGREPPF